MNRAQNLVEDQVRSLTTDTGFIDTQKQDVVRLRGYTTQRGLRLTWGIPKGAKL